LRRLQELEKSSFSPLRRLPAVDLDQSAGGPRMFEHLKGGLAAFPPAGVIDDGTCALFRQEIMRAQADTDGVVYVIDDDPHVRSGLSNLFRSVGLQAEVFGSAAEFLRLERQATPCCLVVDVRLPGLSGLDFQAELAKRDFSPPVIFITGYGDIPMTVRALKAGAVEFLTKPFRDQDLLDAIHVALERDRERSRRDDQLADLRSRFQSLTPREREVVALVATGRLNKQTAAAIGVSEVTVKLHRQNAMKKLGARSLPDLVRMADALGLLPNP
jgi:FixJ family two-component response regulator